MVITATADKQMSGETLGMVKVLLKHRKSVRYQYLLFNISIGATFCTSTDSIELTVSILNFLITPFLASEGTGLSRRSVVDKLCYALSINLITCI